MGISFAILYDAAETNGYVVMNEKAVTISTTPKLAFCIPTYNRADSLAELLESIINASDGEAIEIVVSDNASVDGTADVIESYKDRFAKFTYFRWPSNQGPDKNFLKCVELATSDYCWLMGSDDALRPDAIKIISKRLEDKSSDLLFVNITECDANLRPQSTHSWLGDDGSDDYFNFSDKKEIVRFFDRGRPLWGLFLGYISSIIIKREKWNNIKYDESYTGSYFSFTFIVMSMIYAGSKLYYVKEPLILNRGYNDSMISEMNGNKLFERLTLDIPCCLRLSNLAPTIEVKKSYLALNSRNYSWYPLIKIFMYSNRTNWMVVAKQLRELGVPNIRIRTISFLRIISPLLRGLVLFRSRCLPKRRLLPTRAYYK